MKTQLFTAALFLACGTIAAFAAEDYVRESGWAGETFTSKVIKDLSFREDGADYVAYLVRWKDHEVVVTTPIPLQKRYAVGDSIRCQMMRRDAAAEAEKGGQLTFLIAVAGANEARLQAIADDVASRRALREKEKALREKQEAIRP